HWNYKKPRVLFGIALMVRRGMEEDKKRPWQTPEIPVANQHDMVGHDRWYRAVLPRGASRGNVDDSRALIFIPPLDGRYSCHGTVANAGEGAAHDQAACPKLLVALACVGSWSDMTAVLV